MDVIRDSGMAITVDGKDRGRPGPRAELVLPLSTVLQCLGTESGPRDWQQHGGQGEEPEAGEGSGAPWHPLPFLTNTPRSLTLTVHAKPPALWTDPAGRRQGQVTGLAPLQDMCQEQRTHTALKVSGVTGFLQTGQTPLWQSKPKSKTTSLAAGAALPGPWTQLVSMAMVFWASDPWESCPSQRFYHLPLRPQAENSHSVLLDLPAFSKLCMKNELLSQLKNQYFY